MSAFLEAFLREYDVEMDTTRRLLARVPDSRLDWKPHPKSKSLGELATHVTELPRWGERLREGTFVVGSAQAPPMKTAEDFLKRFDRNVSENRSAIAALEDSDLGEEFTVLRQGQVFFKLSKRIMLRRVLLNHLIHHRGQLSVYLRLNDIPLPAVYGPTADEDI
ncbi:MAG TPA: DinB family protein [Thermoanaerobaculia bacterium]|nr:DinB family protein [Thermoanaerobaculia bacterium]